MYVPKYFTLNECFPSDFPKDWRYLDDRILYSADQLRSIFGPLWINGRGLTQCGFRTEGSNTSQHKFGRALDLHSDSYSSEDIRKHIIENRLDFPFITFLEVDISWIHVDCRNSEFLLWSPTRGYVDEEEYLKEGDI